MEYTKQVEKSHYSLDRYFLPDRWASYYHQIKEIATRDDIQTILEIGPGTTFLNDALKIHRNDIAYKTLDVAEDVKPDFVGSATEMPFEDNTFDLVCAFQVLEHIMFEDFEKALLEMKRTSKKYVFISLPHFGPSIELQFKFPFIPRIRWAMKVHYPKKHVFGGQHYWEIGKKGYAPSKILKILEKHFTVLSEYVPFENQYHHFYIMEKK